MSIKVPQDSQCLTCGYRLRGLDEPVCPECARAFDPDDQATYNVDPKRRRTKRLVMWLSILLLIGVTGFMLWPRKVMRGKISYTYQRSGHVVTYSRWELLPPGWFPFRYPGYTSRSETNGASPPSDDEVIAITISATFSIGILSGSGNFSKSEPIAVNGVRAHPDEGDAILKALLAPDNLGIAFDGMKGDPPERVSGE